MKLLSIGTALACGLAACLVALAAPAQAEKRVALVVGNNDYRNVPKLQKAVNDARTMGDTLKQLGFSVMVAENQTRQAFSQTLLAFDKAVEPGDTAFFFYAGHGFEIAGQNFLLPTDVPAASEGQEELVRDASILADRIIEPLHRRQCRDLLERLGGFRGLLGGFGRPLGEAVQEHVVDHLVKIDRDLLVADGLRHLADQPARALRDLNQIDAGLRQLLRKSAGEYRIGIVVIVGEPVERGLPGTG